LTTFEAHHQKGSSALVTVMVSPDAKDSSDGFLRTYASFPRTPKGTPRENPPLASPPPPPPPAPAAARALGERHSVGNHPFVSFCFAIHPNVHAPVSSRPSMETMSPTRRVSSVSTVASYAFPTARETLDGGAFGEESGSMVGQG
jgi:hypothetical protein